MMRRPTLSIPKTVVVPGVIDRDLLPDLRLALEAFSDVSLPALLDGLGEFAALADQSADIAIRLLQDERPDEDARDAMIGALRSLREAAANQDVKAYRRTIGNIAGTLAELTTAIERAERAEGEN